MDAGEAAGDDGGRPQHPRRHGGVFPTGTLTVVLVPNGDPAQTLGLVGSGDFGYGRNFFAGQLVLAGAVVLGEGVAGSEEHIVAQVVQMPTEAQPRAGRRDVVGGGLALGFHQDRNVLKVFAIPGFPGVQHLKTVAGGIDANFNIAAVFRRLQVQIGPRVKTGGRNLGRRRRRLEHELVALGVNQRVGQRVERQATAQADGYRKLRAGNKVHGAGVNVKSTTLTVHCEFCLKARVVNLQQQLS